MNRVLRLLGLVFLVVLALGAGLAYGDFYVVPVVRGVGTAIRSLPYTISASGLYYLAGDLTYTGATGAGITVSADNVTLDLMGFSLIGPGKTSGANDGIYMEGRTNVEIRNGTVREFGRDGIRDANWSAEAHRVIHVRAAGNGGSGILLYGVGHMIERCTVGANGSDGIDAGIGSTVTGNTAYRNGESGIHASRGSTVTGNTAYDNKGSGIYVPGYGSTVTGNTAHSNMGSGIYAPAYYCTVTGNTAHFNYEYGIYLSGESLLDQNTATDNNISAGGYANMVCATSCTFGLNHAP